VAETCGFSSNFVSSSLTLRGSRVQLKFKLGTFQTNTQQQGTSFEFFEFHLGTLKLTCNLSVHNPQISIVHHDHITIFTWLSTHIIMIDQREAISAKEFFSSIFNFLFSWKTLQSNLVV
jgi:hypothetical protein